MTVNLKNVTDEKEMPNKYIIFFVFCFVKD